MYTHLYSSRDRAYSRCQAIAQWREGSSCPQTWDRMQGVGVEEPSHSGPSGPLQDHCDPGAQRQEVMNPRTHSKAVLRTWVHADPSTSSPCCPSLGSPFYAALPPPIYVNSAAIKEAFPDLSPRKLLLESDPKTGGWTPYRHRFWFKPKNQSQSPPDQM